MQGNFIISAAKEVIKIEIEGLYSLLDSFDEKFCELIKLICECNGKVVLSGIGKSGHVGNKIASTLASTGTSSFFIHASEASHGDLGMISKNDIVILLSNSGETKELQDIIFYCKKNNIKLVSLVRNINSTMYKISDLAFALKDVREANEVNAPTTSTTMMIAFGDAIAVCLMKIRGFDKNEFGEFHPGGKLGLNYIKTETIMRKNSQIPLIDQNKTIREAIIEMTSKAIGCTGVIDENNQLIGVFTDGDLRRSLGGDNMEKEVKNFMSKNPIIIKRNTVAIDAIKIMNEKKITSIFVIDGDDGTSRNPIGVIHLHDCLRAGIVN